MLLTKEKGDHGPNLVRHIRQGGGGGGSIYHAFSSSMSYNQNSLRKRKKEKKVVCLRSSSLVWNPFDFWGKGPEGKLYGIFQFLFDSRREGGREGIKHHLR